MLVINTIRFYESGAFRYSSTFSQRLKEIEVKATSCTKLSRNLMIINKTFTSYANKCILDYSVLIIINYRLLLYYY